MKPGGRKPPKKLQRNYNMMLITLLKEIVEETCVGSVACRLTQRQAMPISLALVLEWFLGVIVRDWKQFKI